MVQEPLSKRIKNAMNVGANDFGKLISSIDFDFLFLLTSDPIFADSQYSNVPKWAKLMSSRPVIIFIVGWAMAGKTQRMTPKVMEPKTIASTVFKPPKIIIGVKQHAM